MQSRERRGAESQIAQFGSLLSFSIRLQIALALLRRSCSLKRREKNLALLSFALTLSDGGHGRRANPKDRAI